MTLTASRKWRTTMENPDYRLMAATLLGSVKRALDDLDGPYACESSKRDAIRILREAVAAVEACRKD
jgi:hypothetical protein